MDPTCQRILEIVREWNEGNREICFTDLVSMNIAAPPTIQKRVWELLSAGDLIGLSVQTPHGTKRLLFVPDQYTTAEGLVTHRLMGMMAFNLRRIADSLERMNKRNPVEPESEGDGLIQTNLWDEGVS